MIYKKDGLRMNAFFEQELEKSEATWQAHFQSSLSCGVEEVGSYEILCSRQEDYILKIALKISKPKLPRLQAHRLKNRYEFLKTQYQHLETGWQIHFTRFLRNPSQGSYLNMCDREDTNLQKIETQLRIIDAESLPFLVEERWTGREQFLKHQQKLELANWEKNIKAYAKSDPETSSEHAYRKNNDNINFIQQELDKIKQKRTPIQLTLFFAVLVSHPTQVASNIGAKRYKKLPKDRYHVQGNAAEYRPFFNGPTIGTILRNRIQKMGYPLETIYYLDSPNWEQSMIQTVIPNIKYTILIPDVFSFCDENQKIAIRFDSEGSGGVIIPICGSFAQDPELEPYIRKQLWSVFPYFEPKSHLPTSHFYRSHQTHLNLFESSLTYIIKNKFPIENSIQNNIFGTIPTSNLY